MATGLFLRRSAAATVRRAPASSRPLRTTARVSIDLPKLESITMREYRIAAKMKRRFQPPAHREFMDLMASLARAPAAPYPSPRASLTTPPPPPVPFAEHDFDVDHPEVVKAREACEAAHEDAEQGKGQAQTTNYHLSRHLRR